MLLERFAGHELEYEEPSVPDLVDAEDLRDVGVVERRQRFRLALEALQSLLVVDEVFRQHLDGDFTPKPRVPRAVHLAHRSGAQRPE